MTFAPSERHLQSKHPYPQKATCRRRSLNLELSQVGGPSRNTSARDASRAGTERASNLWREGLLQNYGQRFAESSQPAARTGW